MKKFVTLFMVLVFTLAIGVGILTAALQEADPLPGQSLPIEPDGHLVYDPVDQMYYCLGTPINCKFGSQQALY